MVLEVGHRGVWPNAGGGVDLASACLKGLPERASSLSNFSGAQPGGSTPKGAVAPLRTSRSNVFGASGGNNPSQDRSLSGAHLRDMQRQIDDLRSFSSMVMEKAELQYRETYGFEQRIKSFVKQIFERLEFSLHQVRHDCVKRDAKDSEVQSRLEQLSQDVAKTLARTLGQAALGDEARKTTSSDVGDAGWMMRTLEQHRDNLHQIVHGQLEKERQARETALATLRTEVDAQKGLAPMLLRRMEEVEHKTGVPTPLAHSDQDMEHRIADAETAAQAASPAALDRLQRWCEHLQESIDQESVARHSLAEVFKQMFKNEHAKLTSLINELSTQKEPEAEKSPVVIGKCASEIFEKFEKFLDVERMKTTTLVNQKTSEVRLDLEPLFKDLRERIGKESLERAAQLEEFRRTQAKHVRETEANLRKLEDHVVTCLRDTKREVFERVDSEKGAREEVQASIAEQLDWFGQQSDLMRDLAVSRWPKKVASSRGTLSLTNT